MTRRRRRRVGGLLALVGLGLVLGFFELESSGKARPAAQAKPARAAPRRTARRLAPPAPIPGYLLIADRGNNRMLLVDGAKRVLWHYPSASGPTVPFRFDDDTFFGPTRLRIVSNQEDQDTIQIISFPAGRPVWTYGHVNVKGSARGYLNTPDDAYLLPRGLVSVADAYNCRVLFINAAHRIVRQYGTTGVCRHDPPRELGAVNGATPLPDGGTLVSEISGSWIDDIGRDGHLRWAVQAPVSYPSDPQLLSPTRILLADYTNPGRAVIMTRTGHITWSYGPTSGPGALNHPSLAVRIGRGLIAINDDYRDRVVLVDMHTRRIVWQYGHTDIAGREAGFLNTPDGLDLLPAADAQRIPLIRRLIDGRLAAARRAARRAVHAGAATARLETVTPYRLPAPVEREVAVVSPRGVVLAGGLDASGQSVGGVFLLDPRSGHLSRLGAVPQPFHDAAGALLGNELFVFGGGSSASSDAVQEFDLRTKRARIAGRLPRPLSDLVAARVGNAVYLVGGYDGARPRAEIYRTTDGSHFELVGKLPVGLRYPAVVAVGTSLVVAGGVGPQGATSTVYTFDTASLRLRVLGNLTHPVGHAAGVVLAGAPFIVGGQDSAGRTVRTAAEIDLSQHTIVATQAPAAIADAAAVDLGGYALLVGGDRGGRALDTVVEVRRFGTRR